MKRKLIRIERILSIYTKTYEFIQAININTPFDVIVDIISPREDDPFLNYAYTLEEEQLFEFNKVLKHKVEIDLNKYFYMFECKCVYE